MADVKREVNKVKRKVFAKTVFAALVISVVLTSIIHFLFFKGYTVLYPFYPVISVLAGTMGITLGFELIFGQKRVVSEVPAEYQQQLKEEYKNDNGKIYGNSKLKPIGVILIVLGVFLTMFYSLRDFGIDGNNIRFFDTHTIKAVTQTLDDYYLYKVEASYDDGSPILYKGNAYGIVSKDGKNSYEFGIVNESFEKELLNTYRHTMRTAETLEDALVQVKEENR